MKQTRSRPMVLEQLEDRLSPALTLILQGGDLTIRGTPTGQLEVNHVGASPTSFQVVDNSKVLGTFNFGRNLQILLTNRPGDIKIDLTGGRIGGNVLIDLGNGMRGPFVPGGSSVDIFASAARAAVGSVGGSITVLRGNGRETVNIGLERTAPFTVNILPIRVGASVTYAAKSSISPGDTLVVGPGTSVGTDVVATAVNNVSIGQLGAGLQPATVGGNVSVSGGIDNTSMSVTVFGNVRRNVTVTGTNADDNFA